MPRELTAQDREDLTPGELAAIMGENTEEAAAAALAETNAETDAAERAAEKANDLAPVVDDDGQPVAKVEPTAEEVAAAATAATEAAKTDDKSEPTAEELAAILEEEEPAPVEKKPVTYKGVSDADYKTATAALNAEKKAAMKQLMDGEIDADAYGVIEAAIADKRDDLVADRTLARANAEALEHANAASMAEYQSHINALMKTSKGAAIDYSADAKAQKQFDDASRLIANDPDNANMTPKQVVEASHRMVQALRGIAATPAPAPAPAAAAAKTAAAKANPPPVTLGGLPAAAPNAVASDLRSQFALLTGEDAEDFLERLPKDKRQALMAGAAV